MKRDMNLVRKIILALEDSPAGFAPKDFEVDGHNKEEIGYHIYIMMEAGPTGVNFVGPGVTNGGRSLH